MCSVPKGVKSDICKVDEWDELAGAFEQQSACSNVGVCIYLTADQQEYGSSSVARIFFFPPVKMPTWKCGLCRPISQRPRMNRTKHISRSESGLSVCILCTRLVTAKFLAGFWPHDARLRASPSKARDLKNDGLREFMSPYKGSPVWAAFASWSCHVCILQ